MAQTEPQVESEQSQALNRQAKDSLPPLLGDSAFWGMTATQLFGAFNDNLFKQLLLLQSLPVLVIKLDPAKVAPEKGEQQWLAMLMFAVPFLLFSGYAGFLSERNSKRTVIVLSKVAEIVVMLLGVAGFAAFGITGLPGLFVVLFLMGTQSAFFGPGKYGILPEIFREGDLPQANGIILMTTFLAIIFGTAAAGFLSHHFEGHLWIGSLFCVAIAVIGTITSLMIRRARPADSNLKFDISMLAISGDTWRLLWSDRPLLWALLASSMFWLVGGIVHPTVNALGRLQLGLEDHWTSLLAAAVGLGIMFGCLIAGWLSGHRANFRVMRIGCWGIVIFLLLMCLPGPGPKKHLLGFAGSLPTLVLLGVFTGMFAVPLQVFLQARPPEGQKGRTIAAMNQVNWIAIVLSALLYFAASRFLKATDMPRCYTFAFAAALMLPVAIFYNPRNEFTEA